MTSSTKESALTLDELIQDRRLIVCVGSGGVGKTTAAAAIGVHAARKGRKVLVVTIDPARRLANALGLSSIGNKETEVSGEVFTSFGISLPGKLFAMMLDSRTSFDEIMGRIAPDEETRQKILNNRIYGQVAGAISTAQEYIASEKLFDVYTEGSYDLIVLDTPPMKNALDFLESPNRMVRFLDEKIIKWFVKPMGSDSKQLRRRIFASTGAVAYKLLGYVFGDDFLYDLNEFFLNFKEMTSDLRHRSERVGQIIRLPTTAFLIVCSPRWPSVQDARHFSKQLRQRKLVEAGLIINQARDYRAAPNSKEGVLSETERAQLVKLDPDMGTLVQKLESNYSWLYQRSAEDQRAIEELRRLSDGRGVFQVVPRMLNEVNDIPGLVELNRFLFVNA